MANKVQIAQLLLLAGELNLPKGALDDKVSRECNKEALENTKGINDLGLAFQLRYLHERGFDMESLKELIRNRATK